MIITSIAGRFNGPPSSANGGYACGVFAGLGAAYHAPGLAVTLLAPPPLDSPLEFHPGIRRSQVRSGDTLIATVTRSAGEVALLPAVAAESASRAESAYGGAKSHPFRTCFVCGVDRAAGDGLLLAPGPLPAGPREVACRWTPDRSVCDAEGLAEAAVVWSVLDCPGGWTADPGREPMVLSRMTARIGRRPRLGERCVVVGRRIRRDGRTATNLTALHDEDGRPLARARAVWTAVEETGVPTDRGPSMSPLSPHRTTG